MATLVRYARALLGVLGTLAVACSDGGDGGEALTSEQFVAAAASEQCTDLGECCAEDQFSFDEQRCRSGATAVLAARVANAAIEYDAAAAARCVAALRANAGRCERTADELEACAAVFRGTKPIGAPCTEPQECAGFPDDDVSCWPAQDSEQPVCAPSSGVLQPVGEGDACRWTCDAGGCRSFGGDAAGSCLVEDGLYCASATGRCVPLVGDGGSCAGDPLACTPGTFCDGERCTARRVAGEPCPASNGCVADLFCDDGVCAPLRAEGESCALRYGGCGDVAPCTIADPTACRPGLVCSTRGGTPVCRAPQPDGAACSSFEECSSRWCELSCEAGACAPEGVCSPPRRTSPELCADSAAGADAAPEN